MLKSCIFIFILLHASACAVIGERSHSDIVVDFNLQESPSESPVTTISRDLVYRYVTAEFLRAMEDDEKSLEVFAKAASGASGSDARYLRMRLAQMYLGDGSFEEALYEINKALEIEPEAPELLLLQADIYEGLEQYDKVRLIYGKLLSKEYNIENTRLLLANVELLDGRRDIARESLQKMREEYPTNEFVVFLLTRLYEEQGQIEQAKEVLNSFHKQDPGNTNVIAEQIKLTLRYNSSDVVEIERLSRQLLNIDSSNILARRLLTELALRKKDFPEALEHLYVLEDIQADRGDVRLKIALISLDQENYTEAEKQLQLLLGANPEDGRALYYLASLRAEQGRLDEAREHLGKVSQDSEMFGKSMVLLAVLNLRLENRDAAIDNLRSARSSGVKNSAVALQLSGLLAEQGQFDEAIDIFEELIDSSPANLSFKYATLLFEAGRIEKSTEVLKQIVEAGESSPDVLNLYAYVLALKKEKLIDALSIINDALSQRPNDPYFLDTRGWIYFQMGEYHKAETDLASAFSAANSDLIIAAHYAKALLKVNKRSQAKELYETILSMKDDKSSLRKEEQEVLESLNKLFE